VAIVHDEQSAISRARVAQLRAVLGPRLVSVRFADSRSDPRVQVADFLAGIARSIASDHLRGRGDRPLMDLLRPYLESHPIWGDEASWTELAGVAGP
jgi:hypothetical protein